MSVLLKNVVSFLWFGGGVSHNLLLGFLVLLVHLVGGGLRFTGGLRFIWLVVGGFIVGVCGVGLEMLVGCGIVGFLVSGGGGFCGLGVVLSCILVNDEINLCTLLVSTPFLVSWRCCWCCFGVAFLFLLLTVALSTAGAPTQGGLGWGPS